MKTETYHEQRIAAGLHAEWVIGEHYRQHGFDVQGFDADWTKPGIIDGYINGIPVDAKSHATKTRTHVSISQPAAEEYDNIPGLIIIVWCPEWADLLPRFAEWETLAASPPILQPGTMNGSGQDYYLYSLRKFQKCGQCLTK